MSTAPTIEEQSGLLPIRTPDLPQLPYRKPPEASPSPPRRRRSGNILHETLNMRQLKFVDFYCSGKNAYQAAKMAGYAESTCQNATELILNNPVVREEISKRFNDSFAEKNITNEDIFRGVARCAFANVFDYIQVKDNGEFTVDLRQVPRELGYAIQELSHDAQGRPRLRLVDKKASFELLGRFRRMATDKLELTGKEGGPLTIQALDAIVQQNITINQQIISSPQNPPLLKDPTILESLPESLMPAKEGDGVVGSVESGGM